MCQSWVAIQMYSLESHGTENRGSFLQQYYPFLVDDGMAKHNTLLPLTGRRLALGRHQHHNDVLLLFFLFFLYLHVPRGHQHHNDDEVVVVVLLLFLYLHVPRGHQHHNDDEVVVVVLLLFLYLHAPRPDDQRQPPPRGTCYDAEE